MRRVYVATVGYKAHNQSELSIIISAVDQLATLLGGVQEVMVIDLDVLTVRAEYAFTTENAARMFLVASGCEKGDTVPCHHETALAPLPAHEVGRN